MPDDLTEETLAALYPASQPGLVRGLCSRFHLAPEEAEDLVQEAWLATILALRDGLRLPESAAQGWLWRVTRNRAIDHLRHVVVVPMVALESIPEPEVEDVAAEVEMRQLIRDALSALSPSQRQAVLGVWAGYSIAELAQATRVSLSSIRQHLWKAHRAAHKRQEAA